ncbi:uncharacterized protein LOC131954904 [Physella acuta]|uniref:uncharacterized protein LOC131954904 n=1 Tax=Physella acuta TaxID=109671 RepID=UPI0027DCE31C|nr:uncharacterized protein LOC131954904 [Physella acuta]XP_059174708.1 uncharacterized protein LOC131954904 [Physella acuta]XP_059174709.1 uncharacterized protein LOC131954904 [Physella acuta]XP_059174710.1 uncharacterized protein LOC131954904 [Physella acuta]XP_059174711.1 uncharacterized protein LOC131954904 [Physella acuta]
MRLHLFVFIEILGHSKVHTSDICSSKCDEDITSRTVSYPLPGKVDIVTSCGRGNFWNQTGNRCHPCQAGTFMTFKMAEITLTACQPCAKPSENEIIETGCSSTRDSTLTCAGGYYNKPGQCWCEWACAACDATCGYGENLYFEHEARPCTVAHNRKCCSDPGMTVKDGDCVPVETTTLSTTTLEDALTSRRNVTKTRDIVVVHNKTSGINTHSHLWNVLVCVTVKFIIYMNF